MANLKGCFSHKSDHWKTPSKIYDSYIKRGFIDPCPYMCETDNLQNDFGNVDLFINPPYSKIMAWIDFAITHNKNYPLRTIVVLVPARTDTKWFHKALAHGFTCDFIQGRLHFNDSKQGAPFPSIYLWKGDTK